MMTGMAKSNRVTAVVLAAGAGTRMKSQTSKVLHPLCGRPMVDHVIDAARAAGCEDFVVVLGHQRDQVKNHLSEVFGEAVRSAVQEQQNGTGHAVACALPHLDASAEVALLLYGDTPLVPAEALAELLATRERGDHALAMLTCTVAAPRGYGRILRDSEGRACAIREERDCSAEERAIQEVNPGMYAVRVDFLREALGALRPDNDQGELYLTDIVAMAATRGSVATVPAAAEPLAGVNDRNQLVAAEERMYARNAAKLRSQGAYISASARIDSGVVVEADARIDHNAVVRGRSHIASGAHVDVGCMLEDTTVAANAYLRPYSVCQQASIGEQAQVGPFSHLRPGSQLERKAKVGNFVETKKTRLREGAKANHLAYLGDGDVGAGANIGAGTIFCNYDGFQKHRTVIGEGAFIGSDSQLVAPLHIGAGAYVATGTTVTQDVPAEGLAIARTRQSNKEGYATRLRARLAAAAKRAKEGQD